MRPVRPGPIILLVALIIAVRVLGISALMAVFTPYGRTLTDNDLLIGLAFGGYGLTLALMQVPAGALSDRFGRRNVLAVGLLLYVAGNALAALADDILLLIAARLLEGLGAGSGVAMALVTDVVPEQRRTFSLAMAGIGAGLAFLVGGAAGPLLEPLIGVRGIFAASAGLGALVLIGVLALVPKGRPPVAGVRRATWRAVADRRLIAPNAAGFVMNATLTATMFALPLLLLGTDGDGPLAEGTYRRTFVVAVLVGGLVALSSARAADKRGAVRMTAMISATLIGAAAALVLALPGLWTFAVLGSLYFAAHGAQSAAIPSLIGRLAPGGERGVAMGGYNAWTFFGSFVGGLVGAALYAKGLALPAVLVGAALAAVALMLLAGRRRPPQTPDC